MADKYKVSVHIETEDGLRRTVDSVPVHEEVGALIYLLASHPFDGWRHELATITNFRLWLITSYRNRGRECIADSMTGTDLGYAGDACDG